MTPAALRAAIASARERPRMYGATTSDLAAYLHGLVAGAFGGGGDAVRDAWATASASIAWRVNNTGLALTDAEVCDVALRVVAALWPQGDAALRGFRDGETPAARVIAANARAEMDRLAADDPALASAWGDVERAALALARREGATAQPDALDADDTREVLAATVAVVTEVLGLTAPADVVALQLDQHVANLAARLKRVTRERDAAERRAPVADASDGLDLAAIEAEALRDVPPCAECSTPARWKCCFVAADARSWCGANACDAHRPANTAPHPVAPMHAHQWRRSYTLSSAVVDLVAALRESRAEVAALRANIADGERIAAEVRQLFVHVDADDAPPSVAPPAPLPRIKCPFCDGDGSCRTRDPRSGCVAVAPCVACSGSGEVATVAAPTLSPETLSAFFRNAEVLSGAYTEALAEIDRLRAQLAAQAPAVALDAIRRGPYRGPPPDIWCHDCKGVRFHGNGVVCATCRGTGRHPPPPVAVGFDDLFAAPPVEDDNDAAQFAALARREGEAFAATHPHAAGAIMGGVAHREDVSNGR